MSIWAELRRRNVFKVGVAYLIVGWLLAQVAATVFPALQLPTWTVTFVIAVLIIGLPIALVLAWAYEMTPEGIKPTRAVPIEASIAHHTSQKLNYVVTALLALAVAYLALDRFWLTGTESAPATEAATAGPSTDAAVALGLAVDRRSVAVLPLANRSALTEDEFFVDGIHDDILSQLARISSLKVISRTSVMGYRNTDKNLRTIGEELGVATILEGGVQRAGNSVRINVQLIDADTDEHLWAEIYDRVLNAQNIFAIQTEIATSIAEALKTTLTPEEVSHLSVVPTRNTRAYDLFVRGRYFWNQRSAQGFARALDYFNQAIEEDSTYALAHAGVALVYNLLGHELFALENPNDTYPKARAAARRALELDDSLAEANAVLGDTAFRYDWDFPAAERAHERAIALNPNYAQVYIWYSHYLLPTGRAEEALATSLKALELDPLNLTANLHMGWYYFYMGNNELAIDQLEKCLELSPTFAVGHLFLGQVYEEQGRYPEAIESLKTAVEVSNRLPIHVAALAHVYGVSGERAEAERLLQELLSSPRYVPSYEIAVIYAGLGRPDDALTWLERAYETKDSSWLVDVALDPRFRPLRSEPRFQELSRRLGLP